MEPYVEQAIGNFKSRQSIASIKGDWNTEVDNTPAQRNASSPFKSSAASWNNI